MLSFAQEHAAWVHVAGTWIGVGASIGAALGWWGRNRFLRGALLGAALGPLGWWLLWRAPGAWAECAACSRPARVQARTCPHCGASREHRVGRSTRSQLKGVERARGRW
jgi:hypothetical protein